MVNNNYSENMSGPAREAESGEIPEIVETLLGFTYMQDNKLAECIRDQGFSMDEKDLAMCRDYFRDVEKRNPTVTEMKLIDKYWSDDFRYKTFGAIIDSVTFEDEVLENAYNDYLATRSALGHRQPESLEDIATIAVRYLKRLGRMDKLDESGETDACAVKINVEINGQSEPWLLLIGNGANTNAPGMDTGSAAAACLSGCISDPLSGRAYAYSAMRITGAADPLLQERNAALGGLSQREVSQAAATGSSDFSNGIGVSTGIVDEIYHPGYAANRMEVCAVLAAAPAVSIRREMPAAGDVILLLGGKNGGPQEERKIQRLFRSGDATRLIKKCYDLGAEGAGVIAGMIADGIEIDLGAIPKQNDYGEGTGLALSPLHERMAVVVSPADKYLFISLAADENLQCTQQAVVTEEPRLVMNWNSRKIVDISRDFLNAEVYDKHIEISAENPEPWEETCLYEEGKGFCELYTGIAENLNTCSKRGLSERFDSTIGVGTVLMPYGGINQLTPIQAMVHKIPLEKGDTDDCSMMAWGFNPFISSASPYHGAYLAVVESVAKLIASGAAFRDIYLSIQEYFPSPGRDALSWSKPLAALLGVFEAQMGLGIGVIGASDSMVKSAGDIEVPPTLISFAVTMNKAGNVISPEFKKAGHKVVMLVPEVEKDNSGVGAGLPAPKSLIRVWEKAADLVRSGKVCAAYTPGIGGVAEAVMKMCFGNGLGFRYLDRGEDALSLDELFGYSYGSIILEMTEDVDFGRGVDVRVIGTVTEDRRISSNEESVSIGDLLISYEGKLESVFPNNVDNKVGIVQNLNYRTRSWHATIFKKASPKVFIPVFPGTNCEYDAARAFAEAGAKPEVLIIKSRSAEDIKRSAEQFAAELRAAQMMYIPGGTPAGDRYDALAGFIAAFLRNAEIKEVVTELMDKRDGLICGIGSGFQALTMLGLVPFGKITDADESFPTLTSNVIGQHQSRIVRLRVASNKSPWLRYCNVGDIYYAPVSNGHGRLQVSDELLRKLAVNGQIATQYVDLEGNATGDIRFNPGGSVFAVEGISSPDGRILGKMANVERVSDGLYKNVEGNYNMRLFESAVRYFR